MIFAYIDNNKNNISEDIQRDYLAKYATTNSCEIDIFLNSENQQSVLDNLNSANNLLIVSNLLALGYSLKAIKEQIEFLNSKKVSIHVIEENLDIKSGKEAKELIKALNIAIAIRSSIVSVSSKNGIKRRVESGLKTGRPRGSKSPYISNRYGDEIEKMLRKGVAILTIAKDLDISTGTIYNYIRSHPEIEDNRRRKGAANA